MTKENAKFLDLLRVFSMESLNWCRAESEAAICKVNDVINSLVSDANRVSATSKESIDAINAVRSIIDNLLPDGNRTEANKLGIALQEAAKHDEQIQSLVTPIIETLQFQDRISQNMNNLGKMIEIWLKAREAIISSPDSLTQDFMLQFGKELSACTAMIDERDLLRKYIDGLPEENKTTSALFF